MKRVRHLLGTGPWAVAQHHCKADENPPHSQTPPSCSGAVPAGLRLQVTGPWAIPGGLAAPEHTQAGPQPLLFLTKSFPGATSTPGPVIHSLPHSFLYRQKTGRGRGEAVLHHPPPNLSALVQHAPWLCLDLGNVRPSVTG